MLNEDEFAGGFYSRYDLDTTDAIEEPEYGALDRDFGDECLWTPMGVTGVETVDSDAEAVETEEMAGLEGWDIDGDGILLRNEFQDGLREWGTFAEFDVGADGGVTEDEFIDGVFGRYDADGTGFIEEPELTDIGDDMGDEGFWDV